MGLDYLSLDRAAATLSGGEGQRIRLATQIGSGLVGVLYILDEPSIGLHQRDNHRLLQTLLRLRDLGNTVLVVEHDAATMRMADHIVDMGPGAGVHGGSIVAQGSPAEVMRHPDSLTGQYLRGEKRVALPSRTRRPQKFLTVVGADKHNTEVGEREDPAGVVDVRDRRLRVREEYPVAGGAVPVALAIVVSPQPPVGGLPVTERGRCPG